MPLADTKTPPYQSHIVAYVLKYVHLLINSFMLVLSSLVQL